MMSNIKAELRKVFTVRSTYVILALVVAIELLFAFYGSGWRVDPKDLHNPLALSGDVTAAVNFVSVFAALIATLLMAHEYRYNTIMYSLTLSKRRSRVIFAKVLVISAFAVVFTLLAGALSPLLAALGAHAHHLHFTHQTFQYGTLLWRSLFFGWGYAMAGLLFATLIRNQIGAIVTLFIAPTTVEGVLSLLLKKNTVYLPFSALHTVIGQGMDTYRNAITPLHAAMVFSAYLLGGGIIAWILFLKRDAN
ncbi:MAG TPA: ABC transporter permease [Candidatus Dormibacteraeota bacterium]|nr:ABC transporter permease [Candidatus Dormibacteraeota bacterium]